MPLLLVLAFLVVPILEIWVILEVGSVIGGWQTVLLLLAESALGAWIVRREGRRAWSALRGAVGSWRLPDRELSDAALVLVGGTLLLTPGFLTDVAGFFLVLPFTRPLARRGLAWAVSRRFASSAKGGHGTPGRYRSAGGASAFDPGAHPFEEYRFGGYGFGEQRPPAAGPVIPGEVVDEGRGEETR